jgi:predicted lipase
MENEHDRFRKNLIKEIEGLHLRDEPTPLFEMLENLYRASYRMVGALESATEALEAVSRRIDELEDISNDISRSAEKMRKKSYTNPKGRSKKPCRSKSKKPMSTA